MSYAGWTIELIEGAGFKAPSSFLDENNQPVGLAGAEIRFIINGREHDWSTTNARVTVNGTGTALLALSRADVAALPFEHGDYEWRVMWSDDTVDEILADKIWKHS